MREPYTNRFFKKVRITPGCWVWQAALRKGYGTFHVEGNKAVYAHRFSYEIHIGPMADGDVICHKCDNPLCVNPDHLFQGTQKENITDRNLKGRQAKGERQGSAKLTQEQVDEIRRIYVRRHPEFSTVALSKKYGVSTSQLSNILLNKRWTTELVLDRDQVQK